MIVSLDFYFHILYQLVFYLIFFEILIILELLYSVLIQKWKSIMDTFSPRSELKLYYIK